MTTLDYYRKNSYIELTVAQHCENLQKCLYELIDESKGYNYYSLAEQWQISDTLTTLQDLICLHKDVKITLDYNDADGWAIIHNI